MLVWIKCPKKQIIRRTEHHVCLQECEREKWITHMPLKRSHVIPWLHIIGYIRFTSMEAGQCGTPSQLSAQAFKLPKTLAWDWESIVDKVVTANEGIFLVHLSIHFFKKALICLCWTLGRKEDIWGGGDLISRSSPTVEGVNASVLLHPRTTRLGSLFVIPAYQGLPP